MRLWTGLNKESEAYMKKTLMVLCVFLLLGVRSLAEGFPAVEVYKKTAKSVVLIASRSDRGDSLVGAGSVIADTGIVVTNAHVVVDERTGRPYSTIWVYIKPDVITGSLGRDLVHRHKARVMAHDDDLDLAILDVKDLPRGIGVIELADPREIMVGEEVVAIGHPEQGGLWTLTYGRISGQITGQSGIEGKDVFQTDTSLNRGNSGGPLLDGRGYLVGVNTNIARIGKGDMPITGVNFAVKSSVVKTWLAGEGRMFQYGKEPLSPVPVTAGTPPPAEKETAGPRTAMPAGEPPVKEPGPEVMEKARTEEERMLTPRTPYSFDDLFEEVEKEMEELMEEMKRKIRK
jgi:serine protease Do